jgi:hypothetical protein
VTASGDDSVFWSESVFGALTGQPLVKLSFAGRSTTVSSDDARAIAKDIIDTAHAADGDAFLMDFLREKLGLDTQRAVAMLREFRDWRIERSEREDDAR